jgi:hypothetical protein
LQSAVVKELGPGPVVNDSSAEAASNW